MKFDSDLYELTKNISEQEKEYTKEELEFAKLILSEFCKKAKEEKPEDGLIKVTFTSRWWSTVDNGYHEINDLLRLSKFNTLFRHYNIYIGDSSYLEDEYHNAYFELIWDYKTYLDGLKNPLIQEEVKLYEQEKAFSEHIKSEEEQTAIEEEIKTLQRKLDAIKKH